MKTAEELSFQVPDICKHNIITVDADGPYDLCEHCKTDGLALEVLRLNRVDFIKQIQLDCVKHGMMLAAELAHPNLSSYKNPIEPWLGLHDCNLASAIERQILTARDNLKEMPENERT